MEYRIEKEKWKKWEMGKINIIFVNPSLSLAFDLIFNIVKGWDDEVLKVRFVYWLSVIGKDKEVDLLFVWADEFWSSSSNTPLLIKNAFTNGEWSKVSLQRR